MFVSSLFYKLRASIIHTLLFLIYFSKLKEKKSEEEFGALAYNKLLCA